MHDGTGPDSYMSAQQKTTESIKQINKEINHTVMVF